MTTGKDGSPETGQRCQLLSAFRRALNFFAACFCLAATNGSIRAQFTNCEYGLAHSPCTDGHDAFRSRNSELLPKATGDMA